MNKLQWNLKNRTISINKNAFENDASKMSAIFLNLSLTLLTHCGLVMLYSDIELGQHWLK